MFTTSTPLPSIEEIKAIRCDKEAMRLLLKLRTDLSAAIRKLKPETLLALARQYHPEAETYYQATAMLGLEVMDAMRALAQHGEDVTSLFRAEIARQAPTFAKAARRSLEIPRALDDIGRRLYFIDSDISERRDNLRKAGVKPDEIESLISKVAKEHETRRAEFHAERAALLAEQEALVAFLKTKNEKYIPDGFGIVEVPHISGRDAHCDHVGAARAA